MRFFLAKMDTGIFNSTVQNEKSLGKMGADSICKNLAQARKNQSRWENRSMSIGHKFVKINFKSSKMYTPNASNFLVFMQILYFFFLCVKISGICLVYDNRYKCTNIWNECKLLTKLFI